MQIKTKMVCSTRREKKKISRFQTAIRPSAEAFPKYGQSLKSDDRFPI